MHRFFVPVAAFQGNLVALSAEQAHQICHVLRMRPGQNILVLDNAGWEYEVALIQIDGRSVTGEIVEKRLAAGEPDVEVTLYQSLMRREKFEWVLQKCTELGVSRFMPLITQRTVVQSPSAITSKKRARWRRIVTEAAEQSRRARIPDVGQSVTLAQAINALPAHQLGLIPWEGESRLTLRGAMPSPSPTSISLFVGPEGGFSPAEVELCVDRNIIPITLGPRILRAETAAVVAVTLLMYELGEL